MATTTKGKTGVVDAVKTAFEAGRAALTPSPVGYWFKYAVPKDEKISEGYFLLFTEDGKLTEHFGLTEVESGWTGTWKATSNGYELKILDHMVKVEHVAGGHYMAEETKPGEDKPSKMYILVRLPSKLS